jgi:chorismate dehydratase
VVFRLGVVSFLNARPLIADLDAHPRVQLAFDVPAALPARLEQGDVDAALVPVIDVLRGRGRYRVLSDACIGCDGETMTVRVFSRVPAERVRTLSVDTDSHSSVALARVLWRARYGYDLTLQPCDPRSASLADAEAVLLIGDKVMDPRRARFEYDLDLGDAWRQHTGLPFVFAVWAMRSVGPPWPTGRAERTSSAGEAPAATAPSAELSELLRGARDRGVKRAAEIANTFAPRHGWPLAAAERYLTRCMQYRLDARSVEGVACLARYCAGADLVPPEAEMVWRQALPPVLQEVTT